MEKKTTDHGPIAFFWGCVLGYLVGHYYPENATRRQDLLLGFGVMIAIALIAGSWTKKEG